MEIGSPAGAGPPPAFGWSTRTLRSRWSRDRRPVPRSCAGPARAGSPEHPRPARSACWVRPRSQLFSAQGVPRASTRKAPTRKAQTRKATTRTALARMGAVEDARASAGTYVKSDNAGAAISLRLVGDRLTLRALRGPKMGHAAILLDGRRLRTIDLYAPRPGYASIGIARDLRETRHLVRVKVLGTHRPASG